ncbi:hypothetical protein OG946_35630 [Streptomyces sp. NBC_01808]|uniref:hypothetical protein n=1 Tax=Streptomyces sp. NBC_01808 TaxID=2975947 RepID=UPI002DDA8BCB|nr:hypothetical protein [Streptomyces sp. NBC_01808]WSA42241.1 hypothetical protein OG946_35630 [Streptomyces sp. NBC_01808]
MGDDDRNTWLDQRAAERLIAGEQLDAGPALPPADRDTAERLAALLDTAARAARPALDTELPGEQAALAAFRAARAAGPLEPARGEEAAGDRAPGGRAANGRAVNGRAVNGSRPGCEVGVPRRPVPAEQVVRLAPSAAGAAPARRTPRRLRRLRTAAAVTAAGCVLGGVALGAGAILRTPPDTPGPSTGPAVSPTATPDQDPTGGDYANEGAASAGGSRLDDRPEGRRDEPDTGTAPGGGADGTAEPDGTQDEDAGQGGSGQGEEQGAPGNSVHRQCEMFLAERDGEGPVNDNKSWNRLVREAGGEKAVAGFCEKHFGDGARSDHGGSDGGHGEDEEGDEDD